MQTSMPRGTPAGRRSAHFAPDAALPVGHTGLLSPARALAAVIAGVACAGWICAITYYAQLGAAWVVADLAMQDFVPFALAPLAPFALGLALWSWARRIASISPATPALAAMPLALLVSVPILWRVFDPATALAALLGQSLGLGVGAAATLAWDGGRSDFGRRCAAFAAVAGALLVLPWATGALLGARDLDPDHSRLPTVSGSDGGSGRWRLLHAGAHHTVLVRHDGGNVIVERLPASTPLRLGAAPDQ